MEARENYRIRKKYIAHSIFIPQEFFIIFKMFKELLLYDEKIPKGNVKIIKNEKELVSFKLRQLIEKYVEENKNKLP